MTGLLLEVNKLNQTELYNKLLPLTAPPEDLVDEDLLNLLVYDCNKKSDTNGFDQNDDSAKQNNSDTIKQSKNTKANKKKKKKGPISGEELLSAILPNVVKTNEISGQNKGKCKIFVLTCSSCHTNRGPAPVRVTLIDYAFRVIFTAYVRPSKSQIIDSRTKVHGLSNEVIQKGTALKSVQNTLLQKFGPRSIIIGYNLENDMRLLNIKHDLYIDLEDFFPNNKDHEDGLKFLVKEKLGFNLDDKYRDTVERARAILRLLYTSKLSILGPDKTKNKVSTIQPLPNISLKELHSRFNKNLVPLKTWNALIKVTHGDLPKGIQSHTCKRCNKSFSNYQLNKDEECHYHPGQILLDDKYSCCDSIASDTSKGCLIHQQHERAGLYEDFVRTQKNPTFNHKILALKSQMCRTISGLEPIRVAVVNFELETVYETLIQPSNTILSRDAEGKSHDNYLDLTNAKSLKKVQEDLLTLISSKTVLVGDRLHLQLIGLKILHQKIVDTNHLFVRLDEEHGAISFASLAGNYLGKSQDEPSNCEQDAIDAFKLACLKIFGKLKDEKTVTKIDQRQKSPQLTEGDFYAMASRYVTTGEKSKLNSCNDSSKVEQNKSSIEHCINVICPSCSICFSVNQKGHPRMGARPSYLQPNGISSNNIKPKKEPIAPTKNMSGKVFSLMCDIHQYGRSKMHAIRVVVLDYRMVVVYDGFIQTKMKPVKTFSQGYIDTAQQNPISQRRFKKDMNQNFYKDSIIITYNLIPEIKSLDFKNALFIDLAKQSFQVPDFQKLESELECQNQAPVCATIYSDLVERSRLLLRFMIRYLSMNRSIVNCDKQPIKDKKPAAKRKKSQPTVKKVTVEK